MPNYREGVQTPIKFRVYDTAGAPYTTTGTPPTLLVQKNKSGAPASATGTLAHDGSGLWSYTPASGEVSAPCSALHIMWSGTGIAAGDVSQDFENDFTPTRAGYLTGDAYARLGAPAGASVSADIAATKTVVDTVAGYVDTEVAAILAAVDTEVAAIKAKTDNLPTDPADASDIAASFASITTLLNTLSGYVDTEVAAIKAKTDALPASPASEGNVTSALNQATTAATQATLAATRTQDLPTLIEGDGTVSAKFTVAALSNAPSGGGGVSPQYRTTPLHSGRSGVVTYTRGATVPALEDVLLDADGRALDLTGYTITASLLTVGGTTVFVDRSATLGDWAAGGQVRLAWQAGDLATTGRYKVIWKATSGSSILTWETTVVVE